jgi:hypothetical protein
VTAVTVDLLPSGNVVVRTNMVDLEAGLLLTEAPDVLVEPDSAVEEGVTEPIVVASPSTVVTTTAPNEFVKVNTDPAERDESVSSDDDEDSGEGTSEVASGAGSLPVEVVVTGEVAEPGVPVDSVLEGVASWLDRSLGRDTEVAVTVSLALSGLDVTGVVGSTLGVEDCSGGVTALVSVPFVLS